MSVEWGWKGEFKSVSLRGRAPSHRPLVDRSDESLFPREVFTSRSSLWTYLDCMDEDKTQVYLERSKSSPINLVLDRDDGMSPDDPFFRIIPYVIGRLKFLYIRGRPKHLQDITAHLSHPAPLLEGLSIYGSYTFPPHQCDMLTSELFNGDLSLLRKLSLESIHTELPWRNMVNLTSLTLFLTSPNETSVRHLLDFLEGAPRLRVIGLGLATLTSDTQNGRLVPLKCLERMYINSSGPVSLLPDHLLIPVGEVENEGTLSCHYTVVDRIRTCVLAD